MTTAIALHCLARRFRRRAGLLQCHAEDEMRIPVTRIAAHGFPQPVDRRLRILVDPIGVAEIEEQIAVARIELGCLVEVKRRATRRRIRGTAQLGDAVAFDTVADACSFCSVRSVSSASSHRFRFISDSARRKRPSRENSLAGRIGVTASSALR